MYSKNLPSRLEIYIYIRRSLQINNTVLLIKSCRASYNIFKCYILHRQTETPFFLSCVIQKRASLFKEKMYFAKQLSQIKIVHVKRVILSL